MKDFLLRVFVFFSFYLCIGVPLCMILIGEAPKEVNELIEYSPERYSREEEARILKLKMEYNDRARAITGTLPIYLGPTAVFLTYLLFKKKSSY